MENGIASPITMPMMPPTQGNQQWPRKRNLIANLAVGLRRGALRIPISRMRELTVDSMMFMMPIPLTSRTTAATSIKTSVRAVAERSATASNSVRLADVVDRLRAMPGLDDAPDLVGCGDHLGGVGSGEVDLLHRWTCSKESRQTVYGITTVLSLDFRLAERLSAFFECSDDREGEADDFGLFGRPPLRSSRKASAPAFSVTLRRLCCAHCSSLFVEKKRPERTCRLRTILYSGNAPSTRMSCCFPLPMLMRSLRAKKRRGRDNAGDLFRGLRRTSSTVKGFKRPHADSGVGVLRRKSCSRRWPWIWFKTYWRPGEDRWSPPG